MSMNNYLTNLASTALIRDTEKASIQRSIVTLQSRLTAYFGSQVTAKFVFGSYSRGTILPRHMDADSDIDYMIVFADGGFRPQTYLDRLRRFAEHSYSRSEVVQSNPTIVLSLDHIRFELVPALQGLFGNYQIPAKASSWVDWIDTNPNDFNTRLVNANQTNGNLIKPVVRLLKYWNATAGYPYESYALEQRVATHNYGWLGFSPTRRIDNFFSSCVDGLYLDIFSPQWKREALERLKRLTAQAIQSERAGSYAHAQSTIQKLLPSSGGLLAMQR